jgi:hypothetical protein
MISMVSLVMSVSLCAGACAPRAKPAGYVGGTILALTGAVLVANAGSSCESDSSVDPITAGVEGIGCVSGAIASVTMGSAMVLSGLVVLGAAALSPSAPDSPWAAPDPAPPAPAPSWSPSAPSGSPLAPVPSSSLSMRSGSPLAFH